MARQSNAEEPIVPLPSETETVILDFIRKKVKEAGATGVVIGLSGGMDSALVTKLAVLAIGAERVKVLILPEESSDPRDKEFALRFADELGVKHEVMDITPAVDALTQILGIDREKPELRTPLGNIKARVRMISLFHRAGTEGRVVLGTGNKSELLLGYFTKFGDGASDFAPIGDLYKTQVWELGRRVGIPEYILNRKPTAGLWPGQSDEDEIGLDYRTIDRILYGIEALRSIEDIAAGTGIPVDTVRNIDERVRRNVHKRKMPLIPKIGMRTIGLDWRE